MPPPTAYTAPTTPSYRLAITPAPVLAPYLTVQQQGCSCISFPFYDFQKRSPTSTATFLPKRKRLPTCSEVNVRTLAVVFFSNLRFYLVSLETYLSSFFSTFFDRNPPRLSNPFDKSPPVNFRPLLICLDAPTSKLSLSFYVFYSSYELSNSTLLSFFSTFSFLTGSAFSSSRMYFCFLSLRQHFSPRQEQTASEFSLTLMIHWSLGYFLRYSTSENCGSDWSNMMVSEPLTPYQNQFSLSSIMPSQARRTCSLPEVKKFMLLPMTSQMTVPLQARIQVNVIIYQYQYWT